MYVCVWSPGWSTAGASLPAEGDGPADSSSPLASPREAGPIVAELAPRVRVEREVVWADARGLDARALAGALVARLEAAGAEAAGAEAAPPDGSGGGGAIVRAGVAAVPVAAELAARFGAEAGRPAGPTPFLVKERTGWGWRKGVGAGMGGSGASGAVVAVERGGEAAWMATLPVAALGPDDRLRALLDGVGVARVGELAALEREAVEVRFGASAVGLWRLARGDDRRRLFRPVPSERPHGSIDFVDYVLTDPSRLLFTANALLGPVCDGLATRGEHARALRLTLPLANGDEWARTLRPARPTASRETWLRLLRGLLDRLTVPDAVAGMGLEVVSTEAAAVQQGDLFDRGFATASAVEAAVARLAEREALPLAPGSGAHPLVERRADWTPVSLERVAAGPKPVPAAGASAPATLSGAASGEGADMVLQLLDPPRAVMVETVRRRDHEAPVRIRDRGGWRELVVAAGPDRISGGQWEPSPYAREYYRCVTDEGVPLWIFRDGVDGGWYVHGYWD